MYGGGGIKEVDSDTSGKTASTEGQTHQEFDQTQEKDNHINSWSNTS